MLSNIMLVGIGSFAGGILRYIVGKYLIVNSGFPLSTLIVNIAGSLILGGFAAILLRPGENISGAGLLLMTGFCGGFTTFSAFSFELLNMILVRDMLSAFLYAFFSMTGGLAAVFCGYWMFSNLFK